jgi:hypothetical protein
MEHFFDFPAGEFPKSTTFCESERIAEFPNAEATPMCYQRVGHDAQQ